MIPLTVRKRNFQLGLMQLLARLPDNGYIGYLKDVLVPDLSSTILVEIPSYRDPQVVRTIRAAMDQAANSDRIRFAVCLQDDDPDRLEALEHMPYVRLRYFREADAPGTCAARYACQELYGGEDFVLHADAHMRFARFWDVAIIAQWFACGDENAVLTEYARPFNESLLSRKVDDITFTKMARTGGRMLTVLRFATTEPARLVDVGAQEFDGPGPKKGAYCAAGMLFLRGSVDDTIRIDPNMRFFGDEKGMSVRYWTHGCDIYHPGVECVFHLYASARAKAGYRDEAKERADARKKLVDGGLTWEEKELHRMEKLYRIHDWPDVDLTGFDLGSTRTLEEYEEYCGVSFKSKRVRHKGRTGEFRTEGSTLADRAFIGSEGSLSVSDISIGGLGRPDIARMFDGFCRRYKMDPRIALANAMYEFATSYNGRLDTGAHNDLEQSILDDIDRIGPCRYMDYVSSISKPDMDSTIVIEVPAYKDPETVPTILSAMAGAANPNRLRFSVCLQDDDEGKRAALSALPRVRVLYIPEDDAPGLCAARRECHLMYDGEDFVLHVDSHMRFAKYWDIVLIDQAARCGDRRAILSEYCQNYYSFFDDRDDVDVLTRKALVSGLFVNTSYYQDDTGGLRFCAKKPFPGPNPRRGLFVGGHFIFGQAGNVRVIEPDPQMYFIADEVTIAARYYTHGINVYQPGVRCVYHLYARQDAFRKKGVEVPRFARLERGADGITRKEIEAMRMSQMFGIAECGIDLGSFGLGTERTLAQFETDSGISIKEKSMRRFSYEGAFYVRHDEKDMEQLGADGRASVQP